MQVKPEQLISQLSNKPMPVIWIAGDETLLVQELCDAVRDFAKSEGFSDREVFHASGQFDWNSLLQSSNNLSLFAEKKLIDLRLASPKLDDAAKKTLHAYVENPGEDNLLLISSNKVEKAATTTKWFKAIETHACFVQVWPVNLQQLPGWIAQRLKKRGLSAEPDAIRVLSERVEGNLLAAAQEIEKLSLLSAGNILTADTVMKSVADSSRFNIFSLIDETLGGNSPRALNILYHLKAEGAEPLHILNLFCREVRNLSRMREKIDQGQNINGVMQSERIWSNRTAFISTALNQHGIKSLESILQKACIIDQSVKGLLKNNPWDEIASLVLKLAKPEIDLRA
jgi:DNA polymerase III subunit delta